MIKKYFKYLFTILLVLSSVLIGVSNVKAQEIPNDVKSIEKKVLFWELDGSINDEILVKSNRFYISDFYKYFLFDLKFLAGRSGTGPFANSQGISFYSSSSSTSRSYYISFDDFNFNNFIDISNKNDRWIQFKFIHTMQYNETVESYLNYINNHPDYELSVYAIGGSGIIIEDNLYNYLTNYIDSFVSNRVDSAYINGYSKGKNDYGHKENGTWYNAISWGNLQYDLGVSDGSDNPFMNLIGGAFSGAGQLLNIELLPGIKIGMFLLIPLVFGILAFILGKRK